jgi:hypothetical protein
MKPEIRQLLTSSPQDMSAVIEMIENLEKENARLEDELYEAQNPVWPEWAKEIHQALAALGCGEDQGEGINLPQALEDYLSGVEQNERMDRTKIEKLESLIGELKAAIKPFADMFQSVNGDVILESDMPNLVRQSIKQSDYAKVLNAYRLAASVLALPNMPIVGDLDWFFDQDAASWTADDPFSGAYVIRQVNASEFHLKLADPDAAPVICTTLRDAKENAFEDFKSCIFRAIKNLN